MVGQKNKIRKVQIKPFIVTKVLLKFYSATLLIVEIKL
jgi:hypothetical protein